MVGGRTGCSRGLCSVSTYIHARGCIHECFSAAIVMNVSDFRRFLPDVARPAAPAVWYEARSTIRSSLRPGSTSLTSISSSLTHPTKHNRGTIVPRFFANKYRIASNAAWAQTPSPFPVPAAFVRDLPERLHPAFVIDKPQVDHAYSLSLYAPRWHLFLFLLWRIHPRFGCLACYGCSGVTRT